MACGVFIASFLDLYAFAFPALRCNALIRTSLRLLITLLIALAAWLTTAKLTKHPILAELLTVVASAARIVKLRY